MQTMTEAQQFFYENAGYSYDPATQTPEQGRAECAAKLAAAEAEARDRGYWFIWDTDSGVMSSDWLDANEDGGANRDPWITWQCAIVEHVPGSGQPRILESIGGVDFGRNGSPGTSDYSRVIQAELALEAIAP
jgi:hypothetical protein